MWKDLAPLCHDINPTDMARKGIHRDGDWLKTQWTELRKILHERFQEHNRSGRRDPVEKGWMSDEDLKTWAVWAPKAKKMPTLMVYSAAVLELGDFLHMGRQMDKNVSRDNSILGAKTSRDATTRTRGPYKKKKTADDTQIAGIIKAAAKSETKMKAWGLLLKYGSTQDQLRARDALTKLAYEDEDGHEDDDSYIEEDKDDVKDARDDNSDDDASSI